MTRRPGDTSGRDPRKGLLHIAADHQKFSKRRLVEYRDTLAASLVLARNSFEPVLALIAVAVLGLLPARKIGKPVGPFPAELLAEAGPLALEPVVKRRAPQQTARAILFVWPSHRVVLGISLERTPAHPVGIEVVLSEAANIDRPEIEGWLALGDPLGERHASATAGRDA